MSFDDGEPPQDVSYRLDEALQLLAVLEEACETMDRSGHLSGVVEVEGQIQVLSRKLGFDEPEGGRDA